MHSKWLHPADQLIAIMRRIYERGLTTTSGGNLSIRDDNGDIWITPSGIDKGSLTRADIMQVKPDGTVIGLHTPSVELPFHAHVYRIRPDLRAVLHAHPPTLVAYSLARMIPDTRLNASAALTCGEIAMAAYEVPGSEKLGDNIALWFEKGYNTVMMENHGCVIGAKDIFEAYKVFETLDSAGRLEMGARKVGTPAPLTPEQIAAAAKAEETAWAPLPEEAPSSEELAYRRDLCAFVKRCYRQGLFTASQGVYAQRLSDGGFLVTPKGMDACDVSEEDIVRVRGNACEVGKTPAREARLIQAVFAVQPETGSIAISMAPAVMAFAVAHEPLDSRTIPESYIQLRRVGRAPFLATCEDPEGLAKRFDEHTPVIIVDNECAIVTGGNLLKAFDRLEVLDYSARSVVATKDIGPLVRISDQEVRDIEVAFNLM